MSGRRCCPKPCIRLRPGVARPRLGRRPGDPRRANGIPCGGLPFARAGFGRGPAGRAHTHTHSLPRRRHPLDGGALLGAWWPGRTTAKECFSAATWNQWHVCAFSRDCPMHMALPQGIGVTSRWDATVPRSAFIAKARRDRRQDPIPRVSNGPAAGGTPPSSAASTDTCGIRTHAGRPHRLSRPTP